MPPTKRLILTAQHRLSKTGWFAEQAEDFQDRMKTLARWRNYRAGESLFEVGDTPDAVFGLEQGRLDVAIPISGDEMVNIWRAQSGFWIGDSALLAEKTRGSRLRRMGIAWCSSCRRWRSGATSTRPRATLPAFSGSRIAT
ncbi:MAG: cyclic nucleotide-binding domain-containing protein [Rhodobacteraceae bacterium]|nr:cyclic nucleotide-binding domain-containing protein [Paracoccaceae bacterium]